MENNQFNLLDEMCAFYWMRIRGMDYVISNNDAKWCDGQSSLKVIGNCIADGFNMIFGGPSLLTGQNFNERSLTNRVSVKLACAVYFPFFIGSVCFFANKVVEVLKLPSCNQKNTKTSTGSMKDRIQFIAAMFCCASVSFFGIFLKENNLYF